MRLRAPVAEDAPAVFALLAARDTADLGAPDLTLEDLREEWRLGDVDLAADAVLVESEARRIVGYAMVRRGGTLAIVAPEEEGQGIGTRLLQWAENRDRERGHGQHRQWCAAPNARARELLMGSGYAYARSYWRMARRLDTLAGAASAPAGFRLRSLDVAADAVEVHALDAASFSANADYQPETLAEFREEHLGAHDLDPELSRVVENADGIAGFLLSRIWREEEMGYVDILAVHPHHQRRGLGTALLGSAFHAFAAAGLREAQLGVASDNPKALKLYESIGMRPRFQFDTYERSVRLAS
jgi:mycothiol synthase